MVTTWRPEKLPLAYLEYDHKDDTVIVAVGGRDRRYPVVLRHVVEHPTTIVAHGEPPIPPWALHVGRAEGAWTIVTLHPLLPLAGDKQ